MPRKLSANFTLEELVFSQTAARAQIDNTPNPAQVRALKALCTNILQPIRDALGEAVTITSGFRSPALNRTVRGAKNSQHLDGKAADIVVASMSAKALFKRLLELKLPFDQLIYEGGAQSQWVHVSYDGKRGRREILAATFPAPGKVVYSALTAAQAALV